MAYIDSRRPCRVYHRLPDGTRPHRTFASRGDAADFVELVGLVGWDAAAAHVDRPDDAAGADPGVAPGGPLWQSAVAAGADPGTLRRIDATLPAPPARRAAGVSLTELCLRHIDGLAGCTEKTRADYRGYVINHIAVFFGDLDAGFVLRRPHPAAAGTSALTVADFRTFLTGRAVTAGAHRSASARTLSAKKIKEILSFISTVYRDALEEDYCRLVDDNPARGAARGLSVRSADVERVFLTPAQFTAFLPHMPAHYRDHVEVLGHTGLRWAELGGLRARDVVLDPPTGRAYLQVVAALKRPHGGGWMLGRLKTPNPLRTLTLTRRLREILRGRLVGKSGDDLVFTSRTGAPLHHANFCRDLDRGLAAAHAAGVDVPVFRPHALRHSHAAWLLSAGRSAAQVAFQLGHASEKITMAYYGHLVREGYDANADAVQQVIDGAGSCPPSAPGTAGRYLRPADEWPAAHPGGVVLCAADAALPLIDDDAA